LGLKISTRAAGAAVAGFQDEQSGEECKSEHFFPVFHCNDIDFEK